MTLGAVLNETGPTDDVGDHLGLNMLEYTPRPWWQEDCPNKEYIRKHLSRHLHCAGLNLELGATIPWTSASVRLWN